MPTGDAWHESTPLREGEPWAYFDANAKIDIPHDITAWMTKLGSTYGSHVMVLDPNLIQIATTYISPNIITRVGIAPSGVLVTDEKYAVTFRVTTANGQVDDRTLYLRIRED